jgi:hypothetical protein
MIPASSSQPTSDTTAPSEIFVALDTDHLLFMLEPLSPADPLANEPLIRIEALHAMKYCERLFYFQEVEQISVAHPDVYAGRRLHDDVVPEDDVSPEKRSFQVESETWGLIGKADAVRKRGCVKRLSIRIPGRRLSIRGLLSWNAACWRKNGAATPASLAKCG